MVWLRCLCTCVNWVFRLWKLEFSLPLFFVVSTRVEHCAFWHVALLPEYFAKHVFVDCARYFCVEFCLLGFGWTVYTSLARVMWSCADGNVTASDVPFNDHFDSAEESDSSSGGDSIICTSEHDGWFFGLLSSVVADFGLTNSNCTRISYFTRKGACNILFGRSFHQKHEMWVFIM